MNNNEKFMEQRKLVNDFLDGFKVHPIERCKKVYESYSLVKKADGTTSIVSRATGEEINPETYSKGIEGYNLLSGTLNFAYSWIEAHNRCVSQTGTKNEFGCDQRVYEYAFSNEALKTFDAITTSMRGIVQSGKTLTSTGIIDATQQTYEQLNGDRYVYSNDIVDNLLKKSDPTISVNNSNNQQFLETKSFLATMANHCVSQTITMSRTQTSAQSVPQTNAQVQNVRTNENFMKERALVNDLLSDSKIHPLEACKQLYERYDIVKGVNGTTSIVSRATGEVVNPETYSKGVEGYNLLNDALNFANSWIESHSKCISQAGGENEFGCDPRVYEYAFGDEALKTFDAITTTMKNIVQSGETLTSTGIVDGTEQTYEQLNGTSYKYANDIADNLLIKPDSMTSADSQIDSQLLATKSFLSTMANHYQSAPDIQLVDNGLEQ